MIRILIILLLIVVGFAQEQEMGELEKQLLYKANDISPLLIGLCALTPTMGHLALSEWKRGFQPTLVLTTSLLFYPISKHNTYAESFPYIGGTFFLYWYYLQLQDAIYLAYQHNADLYEEIYGKEYIRPPKKSLIQKWIDKKEAKKKAKADK